MRIWHKELIPYLPREQLIAQWRELSAIASNIKTKGTPNHILVNKVMNYPFNDFITYAAAVRQEMTFRGYRTMDSVWKKIVSVANGDYNILPIEEIYNGWHNDRYLLQCILNLEEKYDCGSIDQKDWDRIKRVFIDHLEIDLDSVWDGLVC